MIPDLKNLVTHWPRRLKPINRVAATPGNRLRCLHPITGESVMVTQAEDNGVSLVTARGGSSTLAWSQLTSANSSPLQPTPARCRRRARTDRQRRLRHRGRPAGRAGSGQCRIPRLTRKNLLASQGPELERLVNWGWGLQTLIRLNQGLDAARTGNLKIAGMTLTEMHRIDASWRQRFATDLARLEVAVNTSPPPAATVPMTAGGVAAGAAAPLPASTPPKTKDHNSLLRELGWEPLGEVHLDGPAVRLRPNSGIMTLLPSSTGGYSLSASGEGYFRMIAFRGNIPPSQKGGILLPLKTERISVWTLHLVKEKMILMDPSGAVIQSQPMVASPTTFLVMSTGNAILTYLPGPSSLTDESCQVRANITMSDGPINSLLGHFYA